MTPTQSEKFTTEDIRNLYASEAEKHGLEGTSTIQDARTRRLEIEALRRYVTDGMKALEIGCGNGYVAEELARTVNIDLDAFDVSPEMIALAQRRNLDGSLGRVRFYRDDVMTFTVPVRYQLVFSVRCIQNLATWRDQKVALSRIMGALEDGGRYLMLEGFWTGLNNLNAARTEVGLEPIAESWHNRFFEEVPTTEFVESLGCRLIKQDRFLSGYYFGSRVLLPALTPSGRPVTSESILNDFFVGLPPVGDFAPMKILVFQRHASQDDGDTIGP